MRLQEEKPPRESDIESLEVSGFNAPIGPLSERAVNPSVRQSSYLHPHKNGFPPLAPPLCFHNGSNDGG